LDVWRSYRVAWKKASLLLNKKNVCSAVVIGNVFAQVITSNASSPIRMQAEHVAILQSVKAGVSSTSISSATKKTSALSLPYLCLVRGLLEFVKGITIPVELFLRLPKASYSQSPNLIDAQRTLQEVEAMYWNHLADYLSALAELESLVGADPGRAAQLHDKHEKGHQ